MKSDEWWEALKKVEKLETSLMKLRLMMCEYEIYCEENYDNAIDRFVQYRRNMNLRFIPTHRMLIKAAGGTHGYDVIEIDVNHGTFKKVNVGQQETKIRVNKAILGEVINSKKALGLDEVETVAAAFNEVRAKLGFPALVFRTEDEDRSAAIKEIKLIDAALAQQARDVIPVE